VDDLAFAHLQKRLLQPQLPLDAPEVTHPTTRRRAPLAAKLQRRIQPFLWYSRRVPVTAPQARKSTILRHRAVVRVTHWLTTVAFIALLITGAEIVISHPRFYWGETGNVNMHPLFIIPIPASRNMVPTGYGYVMPDQNGWSRALHFQSAWLLVFTALVYGIWGFASGHFGRHLFPERRDRHWRAYGARILHYLRFRKPDPAEAISYNVLQRTTYLVVIFILFPMVIWTGLALSPGFNSAFPAAVNVLGGRQSARTLHFFISALLVLFFVVHIAMIALSGFVSRMRAMITGHISSPHVADLEERP
jgi:thiosulfate reductase cytochrome b subunit